MFIIQLKVFVELGYAADAKAHADSTHKLPIPPNAYGETNFNEVYQEIWNLLTEESHYQFDNGKPFVFTYTNDCSTEEENILMLKSFMRQLTPNESPIDVYPLSRLLFILTANLSAIDRCQSIDNISIAKMVLSRDTYEHRSGFSCEYHERVDACAYCALSKATRWAYLLAKHLCDPLGINLVVGKHLPMDYVMHSLHKSLQSLSDLTIDDSDSKVRMICI